MKNCLLDRKSDQLLPFLIPIPDKHPIFLITLLVVTLLYYVCVEACVIDIVCGSYFGVYYVYIHTFIYCLSL